MKKLISIFLLLVMCISISVPAYATNGVVEQNSENTDVTPLYMQNLQVIPGEDGGMDIKFDLVQQVTTVSENGTTPAFIDWIVVGYGKLQMILYSGSGLGVFKWQINLTNGDVITRVKATFVLEETNIFGTNLAKKVVNVPYIGTQFPTANGVEDFAFDDSLSTDMKVRFKWSDFLVYGVDEDYSIQSGSKVATISDFNV